MISDFKLRAIVVACLLGLTVSIGWAWYCIRSQGLPDTFGLCLVGVMASMYFIGLTFDRYRRAMHIEAMRLHQNELLRADDLAARLHVRDITIRLQTEELERQLAIVKQNDYIKSNLNRRINLIIDNLNTAIEAVSPTNKTDQV